MEQALLDSSKYRIYSVSVDTRFADNIYGNTSDFMIRMPTTYKNIGRIALSSVELPLVEYMFSCRHGNVNFSVRVNNGAWLNLSIPPGNYTRCEFIGILQRAIQTASAEFRVLYDDVTGRMTIYNSAYPFDIKVLSNNEEIAKRPSNWGIGYNMGIHERDTISSIPAPPPAPAGGWQITGTSPMYIRPTPYYLLQLWCPDSVEPMMHRVSEGGAVPAFAKLVLEGNKYSLQFINNSDYMRKEYTFLTPVNVPHIRVKLLDPYGKEVDMRDIDWSLTIELYEIVNSRTYNHMIGGFNR
jgi:hypothetical protein